MQLKKNISDEEIYELREQGMAYQAIEKYFKKKGITISWKTIRSICKKIYKEKEKMNLKLKINMQEIMV